MRLGEMVQYIVCRGDLEGNLGGEWKPAPQGMVTAQAVHAAVLAVGNELVALQDPTEMAKVIQAYASEVPTVIVLRCRDDRELQHVFDLFNKKCVAENKFIPFGEMFDTNPEFYGFDQDGLVKVRTAIAFGPAPKEEFVGITDYLPLW